MLVFLLARQDCGHGSTTTADRDRRPCQAVKPLGDGLAHRDASPGVAALCYRFATLEPACVTVEALR